MSDYAITWLQVWCRRCGASNMVRLGNLINKTVDDVTHVKCYKCKRTWPLVDPDEAESFSETVANERATAPHSIRNQKVVCTRDQYRKRFLNSLWKTKGSLPNLESSKIFQVW